MLFCYEYIKNNRNNRAEGTQPSKVDYNSNGT